MWPGNKIWRFGELELTQSVIISQKGAHFYRQLKLTVSAEFLRKYLQPDVLCNVP